MEAVTFRVEVDSCLRLSLLVPVWMLAAAIAALASASRLRLQFVRLVSGGRLAGHAESLKVQKAFPWASDGALTVWRFAVHRPCLQTSPSVVGYPRSACRPWRVLLPSEQIPVAAVGP